MKNLGFYMTTYLIDVVFVTHKFPYFNWAWNPRRPPINVYCSKLWEVNYKKYLYNIFCYFLASLYKYIFRFHPHRISPEAIKTLGEIGDWYMRKCYTYVRIYGATWPPQCFPKYVLDKFLAR
jgi:hypothetical protein